MKKYAIGSLVAVMATSGLLAAQASADHKPGHAATPRNAQRTWICHRAGERWVAMRPATKAQLRGHLRHGDVVATGATNRQQARMFCAALPTPSRGGTALTGNLTGSAGTGTATLRLKANLVCFQFTNLPSGFTFGASHIHRGVATGPIVVPLTSTGQTTGCVKAHPRLVREILGNPAGFVVNLHDAAGTVVLSAPLSSS
jgi:CHRD domain